MLAGVWGVGGRGGGACRLLRLLGTLVLGAWGTLVFHTGVGLCVSHAGVFAVWGSEGVSGQFCSRKHGDKLFRRALRHEVLNEGSPRR